MNTIKSGSLTLALLVAGLASTFPGWCAEEHFDWLPEEATDPKLRAQDSGGERIIPEIVLTKTPKATADLSNFTRVYTIDLKKFSISNDGTRAVETSTGINQALQGAKTSGANRIVFPKGTYSISETIPVVIDHKDTVIDFSGATLQINANSLPKYSVVEIIDGAENVRLTNGTLQGDKEAHDYKTETGTHEWGGGVRFIGGRNLEVDHLTLRNMTGDGACTGISGTRTRDELLARIMHSIYVKQLEPGAFTDRGVKVVSSEKTRSIEPFDITKCEGQFELGYMGGYMGYPFIKGRVYRACFYDAQMNFVEQQKCLQYRKVTIPAKAKWMHLEFNQPEVSDEPAHVGAVKGGWVARITNFRPPTDVHFHHNVLSQNRRLGMAYCGGQKWLIEDNRFEENGGTNPAFGVDFEDGSELMQDVVFRNNKFHANRGGDLVVCAGSELIFEGNEFEKSVLLWGRPHNYVFRNNRYRGGAVTYTTRTGVASIHDNRYENCKLAIVFDTKAVADGLVRKAGQTVSTPPLQLERETLVNVTSITGTYFDFANCNISGSQFVAGKETRLIRLQGGKVHASSILYEADGPTVKVKIEGVEDTLETGPGLDRRESILAQEEPDNTAFVIDAKFPGGNILVGKIDGDTVHLSPDNRDSRVPWFYWYYRVTGAGGRKLTFVFDKKNVGARGPGVSMDGGKTWNWLGAAAVVDGTFSYAFPADAADVRFSVGMPYLRADLDRCLSKHKENAFLQVGTLTRTPKGHNVPMIRVGDKEKRARYTIAVTCRHHCCEMMASYSVEGILEGALADDAAGRWLRENVEFFIVPFMDTDGVEVGDQGKNRLPHDHNRDYAAAPRYAEVAALKELLPTWAAGRPLIFLDLHDPALRTDIHETVHFLEPQERDQAARLDRLCTYLERDQQGPILYRKASNLRFGAGYNTHVERPSPLSAGWARSLPNTLLGCTLEIAYANAGGCEVNAHSARELGRDLIVALKNFLRDAPESTASQ